MDIWIQRVLRLNFAQWIDLILHSGHWYLILYSVYWDIILQSGYWYLILYSGYWDTGLCLFPQPSLNSQENIKQVKSTNTVPSMPCLISLYIIKKIYSWRCILPQNTTPTLIYLFLLGAFIGKHSGESLLALRHHRTVTRFSGT